MKKQRVFRTPVYGPGPTHEIIDYKECRLLSKGELEKEWPLLKAKAEMAELIFSNLRRVQAAKPKRQGPRPKTRALMRKVTELRAQKMKWESVHDWLDANWKGYAITDYKHLQQQHTRYKKALDNSNRQA